MNCGAPIENKEADQRESEQTRGHTEICGTGKRKHETDETRRRHPRQQHLHRRASPPPNQHTESKEGCALQYGGECSARGKGPGDKTVVRQILIAVGKAHGCREVGQRMERGLGRELRHHDSDLHDHEQKNRAEHQPTRPVAPQVPSNGEINRETAEQEPRIGARGIRIGAVGLPPEKIAGKQQHAPNAPCAGSLLRLPEGCPGENRGQSGEEISRCGQGRIPPSAEQDLRSNKSRGEQSRRHPHEKLRHHRTPNLRLRPPLAQHLSQESGPLALPPQAFFGQ